MRRSLLILAASAVIGTSPLGAAAQTEAADPVIAIVNGEEIRRSDLTAEQSRLPEQYRSVPIDQIYDPLLGRLIDQRLVAKEADKRQLDQDPVVQEALERARVRVLEEQLLERAVAEGSTEARLREAFQTMSTQPGFAREEVHAYHILLEQEAEARAVLAELDKAADKQAAFLKIAAERSTDPSAKQNAGDLGWFTREMMVPEFADAAFTIEPGSIGKEPVKSQFGWHVILVEAKRTTSPSYEEKEPEIRQQVAREIVQAFLSDMREGASVQRFNLDGSPKAN